MSDLVSDFNIYSNKRNSNTMKYIKLFESKRNKFIITENQKERIVLNWMNKNFSPDQLEVFEIPKYPNSVFYRKNGIVVMEQDKKK